MSILALISPEIKLCDTVSPKSDGMYVQKVAPEQLMQELFTNTITEKYQVDMWFITKVDQQSL